LAYTKETPAKPHPSAKFVMSLFKGDVIQIKKTDSSDFKEFAKIAGYSTTQNKIDIQSIYSAGNLSEWLSSTNSHLVSTFWPDTSGQNHKSINSLFSEYEIKLAKITVDGRCFIR
jgi:hypothetical protein